MEPDWSLSIAVAPELNVNLQEAGRARSSTRHLALPHARVQQCHPGDRGSAAKERSAARPDARLSVAGDEHVLGAVLVEWFTSEVAVQRLQLQSGDVDESQPLVLRGPPQRTRSAVVEGEVDPVVTDEVPGVCGTGWS